MEIKPDEIASILRERIEGLETGSADLTVLATEKVTRKSLSEDYQRRLVEEALSEVDFTALSGAEESRN